MTAKKRHTFYYDPDDEVVANWLAAQENASLSIRRLVRDAAFRDGYKDLFDVLLGLPDNRKPVNPGDAPANGPQEREPERVNPREDEVAQMPPVRPRAVTVERVPDLRPYGPDGLPAETGSSAPTDREAARKEKLQRSMQNMIDGGR